MMEGSMKEMDAKELTINQYNQRKRFDEIDALKGIAIF